MRPSVSRLLSWQPGQLAQAGQALVGRAGHVQRCAGELTSIGSGLSSVWSGAAAQAATAHHRRRSAEVDELATVVHTAGQALLRAADAIAQARTGLQSALAAAAAAGCTVLDDGTVLPPARPSMPSGLTDEDRTAWQAQADATAAAQAAGAARLAAQVRAALDLAGVADDTSAAALSALQPPLVSPPPRPVLMGLTGGRWGPIGLPTPPFPVPSPAPAPQEQEGHWWDEALHQVKGVGTGLWDGVSEPVAAVGGLVGLNGDVSDNWSALGGGLKHGVTHPLDVGRAMINWEDLAAGEYGHWVGELAPSVAAAFFTGGATAAVKGVSGATALQRAGLAAKDVARLSDAEAAGVLMRGARPVPGSVVAGRPPVLGEDLSWHSTPEAHFAKEQRNFVGPVTRTDVRSGPLWYGNVHDAAAPLGGGRSLVWGTSPRDLLQVGSTQEYQRLWALPDAWGPRNSLSVVRLPEGHTGPVWQGQVAPQLSYGPAWVGGGQQQLHHSLVSDHAVWTGPLPWEKVRDPAGALSDAARAAAVAGALRTPDLVAQQQEP